MPHPTFARPLVPLLLLAVVASLFAACGGSKAAAPAAGSASATPEGLASTASTADASLPRVRFAPANGGSVTLAIEVPPESEYEIGLSGRRTLGERGMLFYFPQGTQVGFWMLNTHIDLDIAFVDASMQVIDVQTMRAESKDIHQAPGPYVAAVEAPAGWYAAHGVRSGAQATFEFDLRAMTGR